MDRIYVDIELSKKTDFFEALKMAAPFYNTEKMDSFLVKERDDIQDFVICFAKSNPIARLPHICWNDLC